MVLHPAFVPWVRCHPVSQVMNHREQPANWCLREQRSRYPRAKRYHPPEPQGTTWKKQGRSLVMHHLCHQRMWELLVMRCHQSLSKYP